MPFPGWVISMTSPEDGWVTGIKDGCRTNVPSGRDILATLIELLADQENVKITYEFENK